MMIWLETRTANETQWDRTLFVWQILNFSYKKIKKDSSWLFEMQTYKWTQTMRQIATFEVKEKSLQKNDKIHLDD